MTDSEKLDILLDKFSNMETEISSLKAGFSDMENKFSNMENRFSNMENRFSNVETEISSLKAGFSNMGTDISSIKLTLENEIRVNIQRVAEGHLDLSRNLQDAMRPSNEVEMLAIKVRMLESEIRDIKRKIS